jgi:hypothetical protein
MSQPEYRKSIRKAKSRKETIIDPYKSIFNRNSIPDDKQYWCLCNYQADEDGNIPKTSEIAQLKENGLINFNQFHGVDLGEDEINRNKTHIPDANWYHGELYEIIVKNNKIFNPAIINIDLTVMDAKAISIVTMIMRHINRKKINNVMIVLNIMLTNPYGTCGRKKQIRNKTILNNDLGKKFIDDKLWVNVFGMGNWKVYSNDNNNIYTYTGAGEQTTMSTLIFYKKD